MRRRWSSGKGIRPPRSDPPAVRRPAVDPSPLRDEPFARIVGDPGIHASCRRGWMNQADLDEFHLRTVAGPEGRGQASS